LHPDGTMCEAWTKLSSWLPTARSAYEGAASNIVVG
jgi:hypothetical protein